MDKKPAPNHGSPQLFNLLRNVTHNLRGQPGDLWPSGGFPWIEYEDWFVHPTDGDNDDSEPYSWLASSVQSIQSYSPPRPAQDHIQSGQDQSKENCEVDNKEATNPDCNETSFATLSIEDDFELVLDSERSGNGTKQAAANCFSCDKKLKTEQESVPENSETTDSSNEASDSSTEGSCLFRELGMNRFIDCNFD